MFGGEEIISIDGKTKEYGSFKASLVFSLDVLFSATINGK